MSPEQLQLQAAIAALEAQRGMLRDAVVDAAIGPMRAKLGELADGRGSRPAQTLRQVSILFLDVVGSTALAQRLDPEDVGALMDGALARCSRVVQDHGGRVLQYAGDNLLAAFGADGAREDDAERAVRCGLALLALGRVLADEVRLAHGHGGFDLRIGIHTGGVLLGGGVDDEGSIRGSAVNIAARMEQTAPTGSLRISHDTYRLVRGVFDVVAQAPLAVRGIAQPLASYLVRSARPRAIRADTRGIEGVETCMIGREAELEALQDAFRQLVAPGAIVRRVLVVAEAGLGKSRLLHEFEDWARTRPETFVSFQCRATPASQGMPYGVLRDLWERRFQIADGDDMETAKRKLEHALVPLFAAEEGATEARAHAHLLGQLIGLDFRDSPHVKHILEDGRQVRNRGFHAAARALRLLCGPQRLPIVVRIDDLHWADDASLDFLDYLTQVDGDLPLLLLMLARPTLFERRAAAVHEAAVSERRIELKPLDRHASRSLANELLKNLPEVPAALRELLIGHADGNPFYMEELTQMLVDEGAIVTGERWRLDADRLLAVKVPPTLTGVLQARLDGLPAQERRALQLASVIGSHFWDAALAHVDPDAAAQLPSLCRRELVRSDAGDGVQAEGVQAYVFRHQLLHQVTYDTGLRRDKRAAHARVADWLATRAGARAPALLGVAAQHYELAGDPANAAEFHARAAAQAAAHFANDDALAHVARALPLAESVAAEDRAALRWRLLATRERTLDVLGRREEQLLDVEALQALADGLPAGAAGDVRRAEAAWRRCDIAVRTGDWVAAEPQARMALELAEGAGATELVLRSLQRLSVVLAYKGDPAAGRALAEAALPRARAQGDWVLQARLFNAMTICAQVQGDLAAGLRFDSEGLALFRAAGDRRGEAVNLSNLGGSCLSLGDHAAARENLEAALRQCRAVGWREIEGVTLGSLSLLALREGRDAQALAHAQAALDILVAVGSRHHQCEALCQLGEAELALGRWAAAASAFERSDALAREIRYGGLSQLALAGQARVALARGDPAAARQAVQRLLGGGSAPETAHRTSEADAAMPDLDACLEPDQYGIRLSIHQVWAAVGDGRAEAALAGAYRGLMREADRIADPALRERFIRNIPEHREILARWSARQSKAPAGHE